MKFSATVKQTIRYHLELHASDAAEAHQFISSNYWGSIDSVFSDHSEIEIEELRPKLKEDINNGR